MEAETPEEVVPQTETVQEKNEVEDPQKEGLHLYYSDTSFYSQRVMLALYEKKLEFTSHFLNLLYLEQYNPSYLEMNSRGEVPTLVDGNEIITDSTNIIKYLEAKYSYGEIPKLIPDEEEAKKKVTYFTDLLDQIPGNIITFGTVMNPELMDNPKSPFIIPAIVNRLQAWESNKVSQLMQVAKKNSAAKVSLLEKAKKAEDILAMEKDVDQIKMLLNKVDIIMKEIEHELATHTEDKKDWWLCHESFTVADIYLATLLNRLHLLGYESRYWNIQTRPNLFAYFDRLQQRQSFRTTRKIPFIFKVLGWFYNNKNLLLIIVSALLPILVAVTIMLTFSLEI